MYIYERSEWPNFSWDLSAIADLLASLRYRQGRLLGSMEALGFPLREEYRLQVLTEDVVKTSAIEGEILDPAQVRSSVARRLGMNEGTDPVDRQIEGVVAMVLDATGNFEKPITSQRLFGWHATLFPTGWRGMSKIHVGQWRKGSVQVVSGAIGKEVLHFEAVASDTVGEEMKGLLSWMNQESSLDPLLKAAVVHLWFVTIHPFDDGNGRIGRALADLFLARSETSSHRFYSLSAQIQKERKGYYAILEKTQKGGLDISEWIVWFFHCLGHAIDGAAMVYVEVLKKARFWETLARTHRVCNVRQEKVLNKLLDGFEGNLTVAKWMKITKSSQELAVKDILVLTDWGVLIEKKEEGDNVGYILRDSFV